MNKQQELNYYRATMSQLTNSESEDPIEYFFSSDLFDESKQKLEAMIELFRQTEDVVEGAYTCDKCSSKKTVTQSKQTRSADENTTNFIICTDCGNTWTG